MFILLIDWGLAKQSVAQISDSPKKTASITQIGLAKDYLNSGNLPEAIALLENIILSLKTSPNPGIEYTAQLYLGNSYLLQSNYRKAINHYLSSWKLATNKTTTLVVLNNLSISYYQQGKSLLIEARKSADYDEELQRQQEHQGQKMLEAAKTNAQQATAIAAVVPPSISSVRAWLNWQKVSNNLNPSDYDRYLQILSSLPSSRSKARLLVEMAEYTTTEKVATLNLAIKTAEASGDNATLSWAFGALGKLAEEQGKISVAVQHTQLALLAAEQIFAPELMYRWQWQLARAYLASGQIELASLAYKKSLSSLSLIKEDLLKGIRSKQVDFGSEIEPLYRQYLKLLLDSSDYLQAWSIAEKLAQSELESYFGDDCFIEQEPKLQPNNVAIIRSIIFRDSIYLILRIPSGEIKVFSTEVKAQDLNNLINQWRYQLELPKDNNYRVIGQQLHNLLIQPISQDLAQINHLVFVNDGLLRTVPMAALYDGQKHLIEKYSISYTISSDSEMSLPSTAHHSLLAFGLSSSQNNSLALPMVRQELSALEKLVEGNFLLNENFTSTNLKEELSKRYSLLHLATHSSFGGSLNHTYLQAYDRNISLLELEQIFADKKFAIQLMILSGCETAIGDEDALLGLAGIGIRTGISNTIGSIWAVNSNLTVDLFVDFYNYYIAQKLTPSTALKQAQNKLINQQLHPYYWSGFINIY